MKKRYKWEEITFLSEKDDWEKFEKNNVKIDVNIFCAKKYIHAAYVSKHDLDPAKQIILLMIPSGEGWHYLVAKKLLALLMVITCKIVVTFIAWIAIILLQQKTNVNVKKSRWKWRFL